MLACEELLRQRDDTRRGGGCRLPTSTESAAGLARRCGGADRKRSDAGKRVGSFCDGDDAAATQAWGHVARGHVGDDDRPTGRDLGAALQDRAAPEASGGARRGAPRARAPPHPPFLHLDEQRAGEVQEAELLEVADEAEEQAANPAHRPRPCLDRPSYSPTRLRPGTPRDGAEKGSRPAMAHTVEGIEILILSTLQFSPSFFFFENSLYGRLGPDMRGRHPATSAKYGALPAPVTVDEHLMRIR